jgi:hypothetical protein
MRGMLPWVIVIVGYRIALEMVNVVPVILAHLEKLKF